jgi:very-short-patch-repair endonuclease
MRPNRPRPTCEFFRGSDAIAWDALTERELRNGPYRRLFQGIYVTPGVPVTHELRCRATALFDIPDAVITARSALTVRGVELLRPGDPVELVVPVRQRPRHRRGLSIRAVRTSPWHSEPWEGVRLATPLRAAFHVLTGMSLRYSVGCIDAALRMGILDRGALTSLVHARHDNGVVRARKAMELVDPRAESPKESELRVLLALAGLEFEPQVEIPLEPSWTVRADLALRKEKLIVEYDGAWHGGELQVLRDRKRRAALRAAGWTVLVFTDDDLRRDPREVTTRVAEVLDERRAWAG